MSQALLLMQRVGPLMQELTGFVNNLHPEFRTHTESCRTHTPVAMVWELEAQRPLYCTRPAPASLRHSQPL